MSTQNKSKKVGRSARRRRAAKQAKMTDEGHEVRVSGNGNVVRAGGRGNYEIFALFRQLLGPFLNSLLPGFDQMSERGDYKLRKNSLVLSGNPPTLDSDVKMDFHRITHREFVAYIFSSASSAPGGSSAFQVTSYPLNPGQSATFPWLSQLAANYEEYEILGMIVVYRPTSGNATGANTSLGEVIFATNYNSAAPVFVNSQQMLNSEYAVTGPPSEGNMHMIECEPHKNPVSELYVRTGGVPSGEDKKTYDLGLLQVATQGCQTTGQQLGELWITYDIAFYKPFLGGVSSGQDIPTDHFQLSGISSSVPFGTSQTNVIAKGQIGGTMTGAVYLFPNSVVQGSYLVMYQCQGTAATIVAPGFVTNLSWSSPNIWSTSSGPDKTSVLTVPADSTSSAKFMQAALITFVASPTLPVTVAFGTAGTLPSSTNNGDLIVTQVNSNFLSVLSEMDLLKKDISELKQLIRRPSLRNLRGLRDEDDD